LYGKGWDEQRAEALPPQKEKQSDRTAKVRKAGGKILPDILLLITLTVMSVATGYRSKSSTLQAMTMPPTGD